jgi:SAM-dependent methyltransferase
MNPRSRVVPTLAWRILWIHSYRIAWRWTAREARRGWPAARWGLVRWMVPMDPWRYYELGVLARQTFTGTCLDISGPKLLTSLLHAQGRGAWTGVDLYEREIEAWRVLDPSLHLEVQDATRLPYPDESFDNCCSVSVLEHLPTPHDQQAVDEMWRILKPGGIAHITTDVATIARDHYLDKPMYGQQCTENEPSFFKRDFCPEELIERFQTHPWVIEEKQFAVQRHEWIERWFYGLAPASFAFGGLLALVCPRNFLVSNDASFVHHAGHSVVYLRLRKPAEAVS